MSYLLQGNVMQYRALVATLQDPAVSFSIPDDPVAHDNLLDEAEHRLHNILTAMSAPGHGHHPADKPRANNARTDVAPRNGHAGLQGTRELEHRELEV